MISNKKVAAPFFLIVLLILLQGCFRYSFTGTSIPEGVNSVYIPFFADQSRSGISDLSDRLNEILINRFVNQTRLSLANSREEADAVLEGSITSYDSRITSISGEERAEQYEISISIRATFQFADEAEPEWSKSFSGTGNYDPNEDPIEGENQAAADALNQIAGNMFNDAVSGW